MVETRLLTREDIPEFASLLIEFADFYDADPPLPLLDWVEILQKNGPSNSTMSASSLEPGNDNNALFEILGAFDGDTPAGFLMFSQTFSLMLAAPSVFLSDLYVASEKRRIGAGRALMKAFATLCVDRGWKRIDWHVDRLDFDARTFYDMLCDDSFKLDMLSYRIELNEIETLASK